MWQRREIENYLCSEEVLLAYARHELPNDNLFGQAENRRREDFMREAIRELTEALRTLGKPEPWSPDIMASDEVLDPLFALYFRKLGLPNLLRKSNYYELARFLPKERIDPEIADKLDAIHLVANRAKSEGDWS